MFYDYLVVGAGFCGAVIAEQIASRLQAKVLLIDRRDHVAGNAYDLPDHNGVIIHKYGPHIFHQILKGSSNTSTRFTEWMPYEHKVLGIVNDRFVPLPINFTSLELIFGVTEGTRLIKLLTDEFGLEAKVSILKMRQSSARDVRRIGEIIYENVFLHYNLKQWGIPPEDSIILYQDVCPSTCHVTIDTFKIVFNICLATVSLVFLNGC